MILILVFTVFTFLLFWNVIFEFSGRNSLEMRKKKSRHIVGSGSSIGVQCGTTTDHFGVLLLVLR